MNIFKKSEKKYKKPEIQTSKIKSIIDIESDLDKIKKGYRIEIEKDGDTDIEKRFFKKEGEKLNEVELTEEQVKEIRDIPFKINYENTNKNETPKKKFLCFEIETYFRYLDLIDTENRHFYTVEEAIEYKLNEKK